MTTWKIQVLLVLQNFHRTSFFFFNIRVPIEGLPTEFFLPDRRTVTTMVCMGPPLFSPVEDRGQVDFPMSERCPISNMHTINIMPADDLVMQKDIASVIIVIFRHLIRVLQQAAPKHAGENID